MQCYFHLPVEMRICWQTAYQINLKFAVWIHYGLGIGQAVSRKFHFKIDFKVRRCIHWILSLICPTLISPPAGIKSKCIHCYLVIDGDIMRLNCHKISNISRTKSQNLNDSDLLLKSSLPNPLKPGREWRCSWSSADRRCSNYIWVIDNSIAY